MLATILGHVCIDNNESENSKYTTAGSPAVFINKIYSQLPDIKTSIIAPYGDDFKEFQKDLPLIPLESVLLKTLIYENISKNNMRTQKAFNREFANPPVLTEEMRETFKNTDILFVAPLLPNFSPDYLREVFSNLKDTCVKALLSQGYYRNFDNEDNVIPREFIEKDEIIPMFDLLIVSDQDGENMFGTSKEWAQKHGVIVIVTTGNKGAVAVTANENIELPARTVEEKDIVDTVGSGDIFVAAFAYKYYLTHDLKDSGYFANEIARQSLFFTPDEIKIDPNIV